MRQRRIAIGLALAAGLVAILGAAVPGLVARSAAARLTVALGTRVDVGWLTWNPFTGTWVLDGLRVAAEHGAPAVSARRVQARLWLRDLVRGRWHVRSATLTGARLRFRATPAGWELPFRPAGGDATAVPSLDVDWAAAPRARIRLETEAGARSLLRLRELELTGSLRPEDVRAAIWTTGRLDRGGVAFSGRLRTGDTMRRVRLRLTATALDVARVLRLARLTSVRDLRGRVDVRARYDESGPSDSVARRATGAAHAHDLALGARRLDALWIRDLVLSRFDLDLGGRAITFGAIRGRGGEIWLRRSGSTPPVLSEHEAGPRWTVKAAEATLANTIVHYADGDDRPLTVTIGEAHVGRVDAADAATPFSLAATLDTGGRASASGEVVRSPLSATAQVRAEDIALPVLLSLTGAPLGLESGRVSGTAEVTFRDGSLAGAGDATVADVKTVSPDPARPEDVLAAKEIHVRVRRARTSPPGADLDAVEIAWPYVLIDRSPAAIFPLSLVPASGAAARVPVAIRAERLSVIGARLDFRDTTLSPPYWRALANLRIDARAIELPTPRIADIQATGLVDELSPLRVRGTVGTRTQLVAEVERLALPPFNAYLAGGNAPYTVSSGLLSGRSEIVLDRSQLEVDNSVVLSRLGLAGGEGPDFVEREVGVPLTLALALMKDYRGDIALDLPFGGDLREGSVRLRSVVRQAIVRAIRGAILSPLNALGRVFVREGRIEAVQLESIPFAPAARNLDAPGRERLAQVAHVMTAHPELGVRLRGVAAQADLERLRDETALSALAVAPDAERLRGYLRARIAGSALPSLSEADGKRLEAVVSGLPFPADALHDIALGRGAVAAAGLILEHHIDPARVGADVPDVPSSDRLASAPEVKVALAER